MSITLVSQLIEEEKASKLAKFSAMLNAYISAMDVMRYHEFEYDVENIMKLYAVMAGNGHMLDKSVNSSTTGYRTECALFIRTRLITFIETVITEILSQSSVVNDSVVSFTEMTAGPLCIMPISELRLKEYDVLNKCDQLDTYRSDSIEDKKLMIAMIPDLQSMLHGLIIAFRQAAAAVMDTRVTRKPTQFDYSSTKVLVMLGHLIGHSTRSMLIANTHFDEDYSRDKNQMDQELVFNEFAKYSNLGTMSIAGILCCFKHEELLPVSVLNPKGSLGSIERDLLVNMLILNKLV